MELNEVIIGHSTLGNEIKAHISQNFYNDKWLYIIAGIHGSEIEGIYLIKELIPWLKESIKLTIPCIIIQNVDVDGYLFQFQNQIQEKKEYLNNMFPTSSFRHSKKLKDTPYDRHIPPEISTLIKLFTSHPPQLLINFRTAKNHAKVISIGEDGLSLASFIAKTINYPLIADNTPSPRTIEAFVYDFFLCPVVGVRLPYFTDKRTVQMISADYLECLKQLLSGQVY